MASTGDGDALTPFVRTAQIITFGLSMGVASFLAIAVLSLRAGRIFAADPFTLRGTLTPLALAFAATALVVHRALRAAIVGKKVASLARRERLAEADQRDLPIEPPRGDVEALLPIYLSDMIIGMAILEWAAFFAAIAYFLEGSAATLAASLALVGVILWGLPTRARVEDWLDRQQSRLDESRQFGD